MYDSSSNYTFAEFALWIIRTYIQVAVPSSGAHLKENNQETVFVRSAFISECHNCVTNVCNHISLKRFT